MSRWMVFVALAGGALAGAPRSVPAQSAEAGEIYNGRVVVKVYVTLADDPEPYYPLANYELYLLGRDTISLTTDGAGVVTVLASPGDYRLASAVPYEWHGHRYRWNL